MHRSRGQGIQQGGARGSGVGGMSHSRSIDDETEPHREEPCHEEPRREEPRPLPELIPGVFWFEKPEVIRAVTQSWQAHYRHPYLNFSETPGHVKEQWFRTFQGMFTWRPELQTEVEADYMHACQLRLKDHANKAGGKKPMWMSNEIYQAFKKRRKDPNFVARSQRNRSNKVKGTEKIGTKLAPGHHQGSISSIELAYRLKSQNGGVMPTAAKLFLQSHSKKEGSQRVLSTDKAKKVHAEYETRVSEYKEQGVEKESNAIFYEVVGGHKKGHVYGLGDSVALYFERPSAKRSSTLLRPPLDHIREIERARDEYVQMTIGLTQEREKINEGWEILRKEKEEWSRHMAEEREMIFGLRKHYHSLMRRIEQLESEDRYRDHFAPTRRDPRDPFDGSSGASSFFPIS